MSRKYKFWDSNRMYFISFATVNWIDVFTRNEYKDELIKSWQHCQQKKGLAIYAWCIMPSHIHMIISSNDKLLEDIVRDMKSHTSSLLKKLIKEHPQESRREWMVWMCERAGKKNSNNTDWQFWQQHNQPIEILNQQMFAGIVFYIHQNPVVSGFVYEAEQWVYTAQKIMQKIMTLLNWLTFIKGDALMGQQGTRIATAQCPPTPLRQVQGLIRLSRYLRQWGIELRYTLTELGNLEIETIRGLENLPNNAVALGVEQLVIDLNGGVQGTGLSNINNATIKEIYINEVGAWLDGNMLSWEKTLKFK